VKNWLQLYSVQGIGKQRYFSSENDFIAVFIYFGIIHFSFRF